MLGADVRLTDFAVSRLRQQIVFFRAQPRRAPGERSSAAVDGPSTLSILVALVFVQRRFSGGDDEFGDGLDGDNAPRTNWN